jgi:hypothetical protein
MVFATMMHATARTDAVKAGSAERCAAKGRVAMATGHATTVRTFFGIKRFSGTYTPAIRPSTAHT